MYGRGFFGTAGAPATRKVDRGDEFARSGQCGPPLAHSFGFPMNNLLHAFLRISVPRTLKDWPSPDGAISSFIANVSEQKLLPFFLSLFQKNERKKKPNNKINFKKESL